MPTLTLETIEQAVHGKNPAFRCVTEYQPAGGPGDKIFPPTYKVPGKNAAEYAFEDRWHENGVKRCVLVDSVQSQANRMELAILEAVRNGDIPFPLVKVDFRGPGILRPFQVTSLEAPHRIVDAIFRACLLDGIPFRQSVYGNKLDSVSTAHATPLFELCPTCLLFGMWDSSGSLGGLGTKIERAMTSEIIGLDAVPGKKTSSRIDPTGIESDAGILYEAGDPATGKKWTLDESLAAHDEKGKPKRLGGKGTGTESGRPSQANLGNIPPTVEDGGVTVSKAVQTTVLSLIALRRYRFPLESGQASRDIDLAAQTALAALAIYVATAIRENGADLRSRCLLDPMGPIQWELLGSAGNLPEMFETTLESSREIFIQAVEKARKAGLPWLTDPVILTPSDDLLTLVRRSQALTAENPADADIADDKEA